MRRTTAVTKLEGGQTAWKVAGRVFKLVQHDPEQAAIRKFRESAEWMAFAKEQCLVIPELVPDDLKDAVTASAPEPLQKGDLVHMPYVGRDCHGVALSDEHRVQFLKYLIRYSRKMKANGVVDTDPKPENVCFDGVTFWTIDIGGFLFGDETKKGRVTSYERHDIRKGGRYMSNYEAMQRAKVIMACHVLNLEQRDIGDRYKETAFNKLRAKLRAYAHECGLLPQLCDAMSPFVL